MEKIEKEFTKKEEVPSGKEKNKSTKCLFHPSQDCLNSARANRVVLWFGNQKFVICKLSHLSSMTLQKKLIAFVGKENITHVDAGVKKCHCVFQTCQTECTTYFAVGSQSTEDKKRLFFCTFAHVLDHMKNLTARNWTAWISNNKPSKPTNTTDLIAQTSAMEEKQEDEYE